MTAVDAGYYTIPNIEDKALLREAQEICPLGHACSGGDMITCSNEGEYADVKGLKACKLAPAGTIPNPDRTDLVNCTPGSYSIGGKSECSTCDIGKFSSMAACGCASCSTCGAGKFIKSICTSSTDSECGECPAGAASFGGSTTCIGCVYPGEYSAGRGNTVCSIAGAGTVPNWNRTGNENCLAGTHSIGGQSECTPCDSTKFSFDGAVGCSSCTVCGAGKYIKSNCTSSSDSECDDCPIGKSSIGGSTSCDACSSGFVAPTKGMTTCSYCGPGKYTNTTTNSCSSCLPSTYSPGGKSRCDSCAVNQFTDEEGASNCKFCNAGMVPSPDQKSCDSCDSGYYSNIGDIDCKACMAGKMEEGNECYSCPAGNFSHAAATSCDLSCPAGTYGKQGETTCYDCSVGKYSHLGSSVCELCVSGKWSSANAAECFDCDAGRYSFGVGTVECAECLAGKYSGAGASICDNCDAGKSSSVGSEACHNSCKAGTYSGPGSSICRDCEEGSYSFAGSEFCSKCATCGVGKFISTACTISSDTICEECPAGKASLGGSAGCNNCTNPGEYSTGGGNTVCSVAPIGTVVDASRKKFINCNAGKYSSDGDHCISCGDGFHSSTKSGYCSPCEAGKFTSQDKSSCTGCGPGKHSGIAAKECTNCEVGKFNNLGNQESCFSCPQYQGTNSTTGSTTCECNDLFLNTTGLITGEVSCVCAPGFTLENGLCLACQTGFYKELTSNDPCISCKKTAVKNSVITTIPAISPSSCVCSKDDFLNPLTPENSSSFIGECIECPEGTNCDTEGVSVGGLSLLPGYWRSGTKSFKIEKCIIAEACSQQTNSPNSSQCLDGHHGPLCNVCLPDYSKGVLGICEVCVTTNNIPIETILFFSIVIGVIIAIVVIIASIRYFKRSKKKANKISGADRISQFRERARTASNVDSTDSGSSALLDFQQDKSNWFNRGRTKVKILLTFYQIVGQFENVLNVRSSPFKRLY